MNFLVSVTCLFFHLISLCISTSEIEPNNTFISYPRYFYNLAVARYNNNTSTSNNKTETFHLEKLQIIRVPKASSTSLSIVARRLAGCNPPGPCCKFPGEPAGTCPSPDLADCIRDKKVVGCIGHSVDMRTFNDKSVPSISIVREPTSRSLSAFFYPGMHHNSDCTKDPNRTRIECFSMYLIDRRFRNVMIKMFSGDFAYAKVNTCRTSSSCKHSLEKAKENVMQLAFVGVTEMWELSLLLLHYRFRKLQPVLAEFAVSNEPSVSPATSSQPFSPVPGNLDVNANAIVHTNHSSFNVRTNSNPEYKSFKKMALQEYATQLQKQNELDIILYQTILDGICNKLHKYGLWEKPVVQAYWKERAPMKTKKCSVEP